MNKFNSLEIEVSNLKFYSMKEPEVPQFHPFNKYPDLQINDIPSIITKKKNSGIIPSNVGSRTLALGKTPLSPVNNKISFQILSDGEGIPSIALGVAILPLVKGAMYSNCIGVKRGVYAIDQASQSNWGGLQESNVAYSWNNELQNKSNVPTVTLFLFSL